MKLTTILRARATTGAYGNAHLIMNMDTLDRISKEQQLALRPVYDESVLALLSIPVRILGTNEPYRSWRLVDHLTGKTLHSGVVE